jgi:hypothetical protein
MDKQTDAGQTEDMRQGGEPDYVGIALDALYELIRKLPLLLLGPLAVGGIAYFGVAAIPATYTSTVTIGPIDETIGKTSDALIHSPVVLDAVLLKFPQYPNLDLPPDRRRAYLDERVRWSTVKPIDWNATRVADPKIRRNFYVMTVDDSDPKNAQELARTLVTAWLTALQPRPDTRARLEKLLSAAERQAVDLSQAIADLQKRPELLVPDHRTGYLPPDISEMIKLRTESATQIEDIKEQLAGGSPDWVLAPPTFPSLQSWPIKRAVVINAMVWAFAILVGSVLLIFFLRMASQNPIYGPKLRRLRSGLIWWRRSVN